MTLPDGRRLAFAEYGDATGPAVMLFHGLPGSRLVWGNLPGDPFPPGLRIIAPDRPGYGHSDARPGRTLLDWADDVEALADHLELSTFRVVGISGGGPGALSCSFAMPDRVICAGVVAGVAPPDAPGVFEGLSAVNRFFMRLASRAPFLSDLNTRFLAKFVRRNPGRYIDAMQQKLHAADRAILAGHGLRDILVADFTEALRAGGQGMVDDMTANHGRDWGFALGQIRTPVLLWYGDLDRSISPAMGRHLAGALPNSRLRIVKGAGHLWPLVHLREILDEVAAYSEVEVPDPVESGGVPSARAAGS